VSAIEVTGLDLGSANYFRIQTMTAPCPDNANLMWSRMSDMAVISVP
jgi:hypothetical protein